MNRSRPGPPPVVLARALRCCLALLWLAALAAAGCRGSGCAGDTRSAGPQPPPGPARQQQALRSLPYLSWVPVDKKDRKKSGVVLHHRARSFQGLNLYNSKPRSRAQLITMAGEVVHSWSSGVGQPTAAEKKWSAIWPQLDLAGWHHVEPGAGGALYAIVGYHMLLKLDRASRVLWKARLAAHHDLALADDGRIYTLVAEKTTRRRGEQELILLDSQIATLSADGELLNKLSILGALERHEATARTLEASLQLSRVHLLSNYHAYQMQALTLRPLEDVARIFIAYHEIKTGAFKGGDRVQTFFLANLPPVDIIHANSIQVLKQGRAGHWRAGDLLLSLRNLNLLVILDPASGQIKWSWGAGVLDAQHQPMMLDSGNILVFDNGPSVGRSRILELDPLGGRVVWSYQGTPPSSFLSIIGGGCQALPNGNVLITDSVRGRVVEVTRDKQKVWEFFNPDMDNPYLPHHRAPIYRMQRLPADLMQGW